MNLRFTPPVSRFRWVQCQLDALDRCATRQELRKALDNLPTELEATYEKILAAIDERTSEWELARRALAWLIVALEPLRLSQIVEGLSAKPLQRDLKKDDDEIRSLLLDGLSSLVSYCEETDGIALSHFSVKVHFCILLYLCYLLDMLHRNTSLAGQPCPRITSSPMRLMLKLSGCVCAACRCS